MYEHIYRTIVANSQVRFLESAAGSVRWTVQQPVSENLDPALMDEKKIVEFFKKYPDNLVGLKTRISHGIIEADKVEASIRRTVEIAEKAGTRVVVHVTDCPVGLDQLASWLRPGDGSAISIRARITPASEKTARCLQAC